MGRTYVYYSICQDSPSSQSPIHGIELPMPGKKVVCTNIGILGQLVETLGNLSERSGVLELVKDQMDDFVCGDGVETRRVVQEPLHSPQSRSMVTAIIAQTKFVANRVDSRPPWAE